MLNNPQRVLPVATARQAWLLLPHFGLEFVPCDRFRQRGDGNPLRIVLDK